MEEPSPPEVAFKMHETGVDWLADRKRTVLLGITRDDVDRYAMVLVY
jgi:hypothetical protein